MTGSAAFTEIVTLPVVSGTGALTSFLADHPYFEDGGLAGWRVLIAEEAHEVVLVLDWKERNAGHQAIISPAGESLVAGLRELCSAVPAITYYEPMA